MITLQKSLNSQCYWNVTEIIKYRARNAIYPNLNVLITNPLSHPFALSFEEFVFVPLCVGGV